MPALSRTLWLIVAPPLAGFVWHLVRRMRDPGGSGLDASARRIGVGSVVLAAGATLGHTLRLARAPAETTAFVESAAGNVHAGRLGVGIGLRLDRLSATAALLACAVAIGVAALLASRKADIRRGHAWGWLELSLAGALLSFLADGFVSVLAGWTLAAAAAAWLEGWADPRAGAVRATRGALALLALLLGAVSSDEAGVTGVTGATGVFSTIAFLVAAGAMSAGAPPAGAPFSLAALACGGTTALLGPFLLLRLDLLAQRPPGAAPAVAIAGVAMLVVVARRAFLAPPGPARGLALIGGAPAGATCLSLSADGEKGALLVLVSAGLAAALLLLTAAGRGLAEDPAEGTVAPARRDVEAALLGRAPADGGVLLLSFERWVVDAIGGALAALSHASAWALSRIDGKRP
jgi:hypothetical protein